MMQSRRRAPWLFAGVWLLAGILSGCAGLEYAPKRGMLYYHKELPAADRAVEAARQAGKDKECPAEFQAAEKAKNEAYEIYWSCRTAEGIAKANEAAAMANALCPRKPAPPPPPPPPTPAPKISLSAEPATIVKGSCATLSWSSANATRASIEPGIGEVEPSGSKEVCPEETTRYSITAMGDGGSASAASTVDVRVPPPPPPATKKVVDRLTVHVNFDSDRSKIRKSDEAELQRAIEFLRKYPGYQVSIEGHTDSRGREKYNQALSERRAAAVKQYLLGHGIGDGDKLKTAGFGESRPIADNATEQGRFENRRVEILILSE